MTDGPRIVQIPNGVFAENCYLVVDEAAGECAIVDPGEESGLILHKVKETGARPVAIWLTHAHVDHVLGVPRVHAETGAPIYLHPADQRLYDRAADQAAAFGLRMTERMPPVDRPWSHGDVAKVGAFEFQVRHAPGHSPGHVVFVGERAVLGGDVLFAGSIGRTDLPGGDTETLLASIERELLSLPDAHIVHTGHGPDTTIGRERRANPYLTGAIRLV